MGADERDAIEYVPGAPDEFFGEEYRYRMPWHFIASVGAVVALLVVLGVCAAVAFFTSDVPEHVTTSAGGVLMGFGLLGLMMAGVLGCVLLVMAPQWLALARRGHVRLHDEGVTLRSRSGRDTFFPWASIRDVWAFRWPPQGPVRLLGLVATPSSRPISWTIERKEELVAAIAARAGLTERTDLTGALARGEVPAPGRPPAAREPAGPGAPVQVLRYARANRLLAVVMPLFFLAGAAFAAGLASGRIPMQNPRPADAYILWAVAGAFLLAAIGLVCWFREQNLLARRGFIRLDDLGITLRDQHGNDTFVAWGELERVYWPDSGEGGTTSVQLQTATQTVCINHELQGFDQPADGYFALGQTIADRAGIDTGLPDIGDVFRRPKV